MPVIYQGYISRQDLKRNPEVLYLFGDNDARHGMGGQAKEMRGEPNAVGVRTKSKPSRVENAFWSDDGIELHAASILEDLEPVVEHLENGGIVVIPMNGLGTGYSEMAKRCPKTLQYLQVALEELATIKSEPRT